MGRRGYNQPPRLLASPDGLTEKVVHQEALQFRIPFKSELNIAQKDAAKRKEGKQNKRRRQLTGHEGGTVTRQT